MAQFIDASGNIRPVVPQVSGGQQTSRGAMQHRPFMSLDELPPPASTSSAQNPLRQFLPNFRFKSVLGAALALELAFYIISLWVVTPRGIVTPKPAALWKLGSSDFMIERCVTAVGGKYFWELRRLILPIFLHTGLLHIFMNFTFQLTAGPRALDAYGPGRFTCLFLLSGMCGNLLSDAFEHRGVGASSSCYGLIGAFAAQFWLAWYTINEAWRKWIRNMMLLYAVLLVVWELIGWNKIDHFAHLGGLLSGFALAVVLATDAPPMRRRICACAFLVGMTACLVKVFFWDVDATYPDGHKYPWSVACKGLSTLYDRNW
mmetsp:Transcript_37366/g.66343  ORF Transcript_37366/g.66343 Transcript_37366/m.66343 type:complete len:317 (-) Transcript_37366:103-1053(-)